MVKNLRAHAGDLRDMSSVPGLGRPPGGGSDNPLQYPCLENPIDRGAWWATVHRVTKCWTLRKVQCFPKVLAEALGGYVLVSMSLLSS